MKEKHHRLSQLKHQLANKRRNGEREVVWKLNDIQLEYITGVLGYEVTPYLYSIQTRKLKNYGATQCSLLKELHHANKKGKKTIVRTVSYQELKTLEEYGNRYWIEKYKIRLI